MGDIFLTDMAKVLRNAGLLVVEYEGWQYRARGSGGYDDWPLCVMWHHTASTSDGWDDAEYIAENAKDAPLSNLYIDRSGNVWVLAAGATNTNGKGKSIRFSRGTVPQDSMNTRAIGVEMGNNGTGERWPRVQVDAMFTVSNVLNAWMGNQPDDVSTHEFYAGDAQGKIDPATTNVEGPWVPHAVTPSGSWSREDVQAECLKRANEQPPEDDDMAWIGPYLIQATGKDGTPNGVVYATDGRMMTLRRLNTPEELEGYRWTMNNYGVHAPELEPGAPIAPIDTIGAYGVVIG